MIDRNSTVSLAEKVGLLFNNEDQPYSTPAHMRLISKLEKFAQECFNAGYKDGKFDSNTEGPSMLDSW